MYRRLVYWSQVLRLPPRAALFYVRAVRLAKRIGDDWSLRSATPPHHLLLLLRLAKGRRQVVELGTGTAWTAIVLALADRRRQVRTFDPLTLGPRDRYLALAPRAHARITIQERSGDLPDAQPVDFLFVDSSHDRDATEHEFNAWRPYLTPGAIVAFHDHPIPDVGAAITDLGLNGVDMAGVYVWRNASSLP